MISLKWLADDKEDRRYAENIPSITMEGKDVIPGSLNVMIFPTIVLRLRCGSAVTKPLTAGGALEQDSVY